MVEITASDVTLSGFTLVNLGVGGMGLLGIGIIPLRSAREEISEGRLVAWWIEGSQINWELGLAKLAGDYDSPIGQTFIHLSKKYFNSEAQQPAPGKKVKPAGEKRKRAAHAR